MTVRRITQVSISAVGLSLLMLSGAASASGYWHPANNESGVTVHPDHFKSSKTREEVRAEAIEARRNGEMWQATESGEPPRVQPQPKSLSRNVSTASEQGTSE
ncbi:MAG: DUF4148 domain-containing protein [Pusillimonas sp.]